MRDVVREIQYDQQSNAIYDCPKDIVFSCQAGFVHFPRVEIDGNEILGNQLLFFRGDRELESYLGVGTYLYPFSGLIEKSFLPFLRTAYEGEGDEFECSIVRKPSLVIVERSFQLEGVTGLNRLTLSSEYRFPVIIKKENEITLANGHYQKTVAEAVSMQPLKNGMALPALIHVYSGPLQAVRGDFEKPFVIQQWKGEFDDASRPEDFVLDVGMSDPLRVQGFHSFKNGKRLIAEIKTHIRATDGKFDVKAIFPLINQQLPDGSSLLSKRTDHAGKTAPLVRDPFLEAAESSSQENEPDAERTGVFLWMFYLFAAIGIVFVGFAIWSRWASTR